MSAELLHDGYLLLIAGPFCCQHSWPPPQQADGESNVPKRERQAFGSLHVKLRVTSTLLRWWPFRFLFLMEFEMSVFGGGSSLSVVTNVHHKKNTVFGRPVVLRCAHLGKQTWWYIISFVTLSTLLFSSSSVAPEVRCLCFKGI